MNLAIIVSAIVIGYLIIVSIAKGDLPTSLIARKRLFRSDFDVTDDIENGITSGLSLYIDYGTGVQYVSSPLGGLTPRIDANGQPIVHEKIAAIARARRDSARRTINEAS